MPPDKPIKLKKNPDGSQQYVRGKDFSERSENIRKAIKASSAKGQKQNRTLTLLGKAHFDELDPETKAIVRKRKGNEQRRALAEGRRYPAIGASYKKGGAVTRGKKK